MTDFNLVVDEDVWLLPTSSATFDLFITTPMNGSVIDGGDSGGGGDDIDGGDA